MSKVFVIEDEIAINKMICMYLGVSGYETIPAYDGNEVMLKLTNGDHFDIALLDVMLPGIDGFKLLPQLRERGIPVIFLTAKDDLESKLKGLTGGADDYMVKPFEMPELIVRMQKVLERTGKTDDFIYIDGLVINTKERTIKESNKNISLTPIEFDLLLLLVRNRNVAISRGKLLSDVWGILYEGGTRTVDVHIAQLRKKTKLNIVSVPKIGYRLEVST